LDASVSLPSADRLFQKRSHPCHSRDNQPTVSETVSVPVSPDFVYTDCSNPDQEPAVYCAGDFLWPDNGIDYFFTLQNTTITIENGNINTMQRIYMP